MKQVMTSFCLAVAFGVSAFAHGEVSENTRIAASEISKENVAASSADVLEYAFFIFVLPAIHLALEAANAPN